MKNTILILAIIIASIFISCEKDATVTPPKTDKQVVVSSYISPNDDYVTIYLNWSMPLYNGTSIYQNTRIENATVTITDGANVVTIPYTENSQDLTAGKYAIATTSYPIQAGKTYSLAIQIPGYDKTITATIYIPMPIDAHTITITKGVDNSYRIKGNITDNSTESTYGVVIKGGYDYYPTSVNNLDYRDFDYYPNNFELRTSKQYDVTYNKYMTGLENNETTIIDSLKVLTYHLSKDYYNFAKNNLVAVESDSNPFAEPYTIYTNIQNGLGIFAGYSTKQEILVDVP